MANSIYGQLLRNPRKDRNLELVRSGKRFRKLIAMPTTKGFKIFGEDLVVVEKTPPTIIMNNLPAAGLAVLDLSKKLMMELYWRIKGQFGDRCQMLLTDTDSLAVELQSDDIVEDLRPLMDVLDTSSLPPEHPLYDARYARVQGRLKIEYGGFRIQRFAAVRSKVYALDLASPNGKSVVYKAKGVQKSALKRSVEFEDYKRCVFDSVAKYVTFHSIRTDGQHRLYTLKQTKVGLQNFDNKRYIEPCGIRTRAFGYRPVEQLPNKVGSFSALVFLPGWPNTHPLRACVLQDFWEDMEEDHVAAHVDQVEGEMQVSRRQNVKCHPFVKLFMKDPAIIHVQDNWGPEDDELLDVMMDLADNAS